jgi:hypothetical protein
MTAYQISGGMENSFQDFFNYLKGDLRSTEPINRREWQKLDVSQSPPHYVHERLNLSIRYSVPYNMEAAQKAIQPDLPWAEDHFQERVGGVPLNPPPSYTEWPHHHGDASRHTADGKFDHTYPERFWPIYAGDAGKDANHDGNRGIRFAYGDLADVCTLLREKPLTRQAYLPVWFPEDTGVNWDQRVPCTLGYHFQYDPTRDVLDLTYMIRSCDLIRHLRNDVYMAVRLLHWMADEVCNPMGEDMNCGHLIMHIMNLHTMKGDSGK